MAAPVPFELTRLLDHREASTRDEAWTAFVQAHSKLILHVARSLGGDHDDVMDRYAWVLEQLRREDFHRLRAYAADGRGKFTTWLVAPLDCFTTLPGATRTSVTTHRKRTTRDGSTRKSPVTLVTGAPRYSATLR